MRPGYCSDEQIVGGNTVLTAALSASTFAARFLGLSLVTWLVIIVLVVVVAGLMSRRRF
jgi:hypothetical protein